MPADEPTLSALLAEGKMPFNQRVVDIKAPLLLRPLDDDPADKRNWVIKAIERTGQPIEAAIRTWVSGFAVEDNLMWDAMTDHLGPHEAAQAYEDVWSRIPQSYQDGVSQVLTMKEPAGVPRGLSMDIDADEVVARMGFSPEEVLVFWNRGFTGHDHQMWRAWEDRYGARDAVIMYSAVWQGFALSLLDDIRASIGRAEIETTDDLSAMNRAYWEAIGCEVEDVELTPDRFVAVIKTCPYFDNMVDMYGKEAASEMMKKTIGPTSANYYQALMKAIGLWEEFYVTQDQFRSLGDSVCRMVYQRRAAAPTP